MPGALLAPRAEHFRSAQTGPHCMPTASPEPGRPPTRAPIGHRACRGQGAHGSAHATRWSNLLICLAIMSGRWMGGHRWQDGVAVVEYACLQLVSVYAKCRVAGSLNMFTLVDCLLTGNMHAHAQSIGAHRSVAHLACSAIRAAIKFLTQ